MAKTTKKTTTKKAQTKKAAKAKARKPGVGAFVFAMIAKGASNQAIQEAVAKAFPDSALNQNPSAHIGWYRSKHNAGVPAKERKPAKGKATAKAA